MKKREICVGMLLQIKYEICGIPVLSIVKVELIDEDGIVVEYNGRMVNVPVLSLQHY